MGVEVLVMGKWIFTPAAVRLERLVRRDCMRIADHAKSGKAFAAS